MATLGTQDMAQYMAANAIKRGDTNMGLGYMLGSMLANAWNRHDTKKQQKKMDAFLDSQKAPSTDMSGFIQEKTLPQDQYNALTNGSVNSVAPAQTGVNETPIQTPSLTDQAISAIGGGGFRDYVDNAPVVEKPFNPNRMKEFEQFARDNNLRDEVYKRGAERIKREQMQDAEALYLPKIRNNLYGYTDKDGFHAPTTDSRIQALNDLDELVKYSPDKANLYSKLGLAELGEASKFARNRAAAKEDQQAKLNQAVTVANIRGQYQNKNKTNNISGYSAKDIGNMRKEYETLLGDIDTMKAEAKESDGKFSAEKNELFMSKQRRLNQLRGILYPGQEQGDDNTPKGNANPMAKVDAIFEGVNLNDYEAALGPKGAYQKATDYLKSVKDENGKRKYSDKAIADIMLDHAGNVYGKDNSYYQDLAHSFGVKTDTDRAIEEAKRKQKLQEDLFPKEPFALKTDDSMGKKIEDDYKKKNHLDQYGYDYGYYG